MERLAEVLMENYDIKVLDVEKIKNVYKVKTDEGYKCFKASKYDINQFKFIVDAIEHLSERDFNSVLPIYRNKEGDKFIRLDNRYGFLCDWVESRQANFKNLTELKMCIETLSNFHIYSRDFDGSDISRARRYYGRWIEKFNKRSKELLYFKALIAARGKKSEFDSIYLRYFDIHYKQSLKAIRELKDSKYIEVMQQHEDLKEFCHHDTANHNFLITDYYRMYMIDFDYCIYDSHLHDLGSIIIRNLKHGNWDFDLMEFILKVYSRNIPISRDELNIIFCFMEFPQDFWQVGLQYYVEKQPWEEEFFIRKLNRVVIDSRARMEFLDILQRNILEGYYV